MSTAVSVPPACGSLLLPVTKIHFILSHYIHEELVNYTAVGIRMLLATGLIVISCYVCAASIIVSHLKAVGCIFLSEPPLNLYTFCMFKAQTIDH